MCLVVHNFMMKGTLGIVCGVDFLLQFGGALATTASAHDDAVFGIHGAHGRDLSWDEH